MKVDILILSTIYDFSTDLVIQELEKRAVRYLRLNKENLAEYRITIIPDKVLMKIERHGDSFVVDDSVQAIWYRQPIFLRNTPGQSLTVKEQLIRSQWMGFLRSLMIFKNARWMNWPESTYIAETKAYQLLEAHKLGFKIPKTKIGNNVEEFRSFGDEAIIKSLDTVLLREGNDCLFTYSTVARPNELRDEEICDVPLTVQEYVYPKTDIRVTVVDDKLFAVKITSHGASINEDWRIISRDKVEYTNIALPYETNRRCLSLVKLLGLNFGAIDLVESNGEHIFIEINPTGEWGWIVTSERRIDSCIADWLVGDLCKI
jgi:glutathione synthase/RimK-type ligase-like ATP-grasp enzyme